MAAASSALPDVHLPVRSISLPSRLHSNSLKLEAALNHLKAWQTSSASAAGVPIGAETIQIGLVGLAELYGCVQDFIHSPQTQRALLQHQNGKLVEAALDESVTMLDTCDTARDSLLRMKEHVHTLQSTLRRMRGNSSIEADIAVYLSFRKKVKREVAKSLGTLTKRGSEVFGSSMDLDVDHHVSKVATVLREATSLTISVLQSLLLFLSMPEMKTRAGKLSLVSKLIPLRLLSSSEGQKMISEVGAVDLAIHSFHGRLKSGDAKADVQMLQRMLVTLDDSINALEVGLDSIFKCLVQNRFSFLNVITHH